jgi:hypothetical protein
MQKKQKDPFFSDILMTTPLKIRNIITLNIFIKNE